MEMCGLYVQHEKGWLHKVVIKSNMKKGWLYNEAFTSNMKKGWLRKAVLVEHEKGLALRFSSSMKKG